MNAPHVLFLGTGGSSGQTLALVEAAIRARAAEARFTFVDTQPFNLRSGGTTRYPGGGAVRTLRPQACGIPTRTGSQTVNLMLGGGPLAYRRMTAHAATALDPRPDVVVACHDRMYAETALLHAAKRRGIPTVLLQEGPFCAIGDARPQNVLLRAKAALAPLVTRSGLVPAIPDYGMFGHDRVLAASPAYRRRWIAAGLAAHSVDVCGIPRFDRLRGHRMAAPAPPFPLRLLYLAQPFAVHGKVDTASADAALDVIGAGLRLAMRQHAVELVIRRHPRSTGAEVEGLLRRLDFAPRLDDGHADIAQAIAGCHATLGHYSTGLLESLLIGRPVLCVPVAEGGFAERSEADKQVWLASTGIPVARSAEEFAAALGRIAAGNGMASVRDERLEEETGPSSGDAADRAARSILAMCGR